MKRSHVIAIAVMLLAAAAILTGCSDKRTRISAILGHPDEFMDRDVLVGGKVTKAFAADLIITEAGAYQIDDGTGRIWVLTKSGVPEEGRTVALKGTVSPGLKIGGETFGAILQEIDRQTK